MRYGYCRLKDCNVMEDIRSETDKYVSLGVRPENIYFEYHSFELQPDVQIFTLFENVEKGDIIVAPTMNRIARTINQFLVFLDLCLNSRVCVEIEGLTLDFSKLSADTRTLIRMMLLVKSNLLSQATRRAMENLKRKGKRIGSKPVVYSRLSETVKRYYPLYKAGAINKKEYAMRCSVNRNTIARYIKIIEQHERKKSGN